MAMKHLALREDRGSSSAREIAALYDKYFNSPIPPHGLNLKFPMSAALKRALANPTDSGDPAVYE